MEVRRTRSGTALGSFGGLPGGHGRICASREAPTAPLARPLRNRRGARTRVNEMSQDFIPTVLLEEAVLQICSIPLATMGPNVFVRVLPELVGSHLDPLWPMEYYIPATPPAQDPRWE